MPDKKKSAIPNPQPEIPPPPRVLGVDPGLNITGYAVLEVAVGGPRLCEAGVVRGRTRNSLTAVASAEIHAGLTEVIASLHPNRHGLGTTLLALPASPHLDPHGPCSRRDLGLSAAQAGITVVHYSATQVKKLSPATAASKSQIQHAV